MVMPRKSTYSDFSDEELIVVYAMTFCKETKKARKQEQAILQELANRGIIDKDKMDELYERMAL